MATINVGGRSEPVVDRILTQPVEIFGFCDVVGLDHRGVFRDSRIVADPVGARIPALV